MDQKKVHDLLRQAYPKHKIVEDQERTYAESDAPDVDIKSTSLGAWKKLGTPPVEKSAADDSRTADLRYAFRGRKLVGAGPARPESQRQPSQRRRGLDVSQQPAGKVELKRLVTDDAADDTDDTLDVLVDEEHGIIGESDSGPDEDK